MDGKTEKTQKVLNPKVTLEQIINVFSFCVTRRHRRPKRTNGCWKKRTARNGTENEEKSDFNS